MPHGPESYRRMNSLPDEVPAELMGSFAEEFFAELDGMTLEEARANRALRSRLDEQADTYRRTLPNAWPITEVSWDLAPVSQRYSLDGIQSDVFAKHYSAGFILGWADLVDIDQHLHSSAYRSPDELWTLGSSSKLANVIAYLGNGGSVSPPLLQVVEVEGKETIGIAGGHHRFAVAKALNMREIPFYIADVEQRKRLMQMFAVRWSVSF